MDWFDVVQHTDICRRFYVRLQAYLFCKMRANFLFSSENIRFLARTSGGRSVGIVRWRTKAPEFVVC
jgi:hypothetical protein